MLFHAEAWGKDKIMWLKFFVCFSSWKVKIKHYRYSLLHSKFYCSMQMHLLDLVYMKKIVKYKLKLFCTSFYPMGPLRLRCASQGSTHSSMTWYTLQYFWKNPQPLIVRSAVRWKLKPPSFLQDKVAALPLIPHIPFPLIHFDRVRSLVFSVVSV